MSARGEASILIVLADGKVEIRHGTDGNVLARKDKTETDDWERLWTILTEIWGAERTRAGGG